MATSTGNPSEEEKRLMEAIRPKLEESLQPSEILNKLKGKLKEETIDNITDIVELDCREEAVKLVIDAVLKHNIVSEFFQILMSSGYLNDLDDPIVSDIAARSTEVYNPASGSTNQGPVPDPPMQDNTSRPESEDNDILNFSDGEEEMETSENTDELPMRKYQKELCKVAIKGENTIICAPTGSGKTRVALNIVIDHLQNKSNRGEKKIVFLARTAPLVNQQAKTFKNSLPAACKSKVCEVTGDTNLSINFHMMLDYFDIFVMTPQILDNHLIDEKIKSLNRFSLLILDECHHTRKGEPYNSLMKKYLKAKKEKEDGLPQIIGLTASLGVEKATKIEEATLSILKLCGNLDVEKISTVTENKEELEKTVPKPDERREELVGSRRDNARKQIHSTMLKIEEHLDEAVSELGNKEIRALKKNRPPDPSSQSYGQWAVKIKRSAMEAIGETEQDKLLTRTILVTARHLEVYNASMDIHDLVRLSDVVEYLEENLMENTDKNKQSGVETELLTYFKELKSTLKRIAIDDENPNLRILKNEIIKLRKEKGDDSRGIIFVKTRGTCYAICNWMRSDSDLGILNATPFTGAGAHEEKGGMTQHQQDDAIESFKAGTTKFLVATSVAEEGLDIPECNIVIRYNHVGNEITTVQTRGRSRKRGGTSVLLGMDEVLKREMLNIEKTKIMEEAILEFRRMPLDKKKEQIKIYQENVIQEEELKEKINKGSQNKKIKTHFQLRCLQCKKLEIDNKFIKTIENNHHVVIDPEFMSKVDLKQDQSPRKPFDGIQITGKIHCKECNYHLGVMFRYRGIRFPSIAVKNFQITSNGPPMVYKKWKELPFLIHEITHEDKMGIVSRNRERRSREQGNNEVKSPQYGEQEERNEEDMDETDDPLNLE